MSACKARKETDQSVLFNRQLTFGCWNWIFGLIVCLCRQPCSITRRLKFDCIEMIENSDGYSIQPPLQRGGHPTWQYRKTIWLWTDYVEMTGSSLYVDLYRFIIHDKFRRIGWRPSPRLSLLFMFCKQKKILYCDAGVDRFRATGPECLDQ